MSEEDIKKLCKEYADNTVESYGFSAETVEELKEEQASKALSVIRFLLRDYCIVPKEVIMAIYNRKTIPTKEDVNNKFVEECVITAIFPELFEQKGE